MRQATKLELHQMTIDAARAVLHQQNIGYLVEKATQRAVGERFADESVAAAALAPLEGDIRRFAEEEARVAATATATSVVEQARETVEKVRDEVASLVSEAAEGTREAVAEARENVLTVARAATTQARDAAGEAREEVRAAAQDAAERARDAADRARGEIAVLTRDATRRTGESLDSARAEVVDLARAAAEQACATFVPSPIEVTLPNGRVNRVVGDKHRVLPELILALGARCHVLLVGPAGTGKSTLATQAATGLGLELQAISLGPTTPMSKVFGYFDAHGTYHDTPFRRAFEHGGVMLFDELDNGHPGLLAELNQALALGVCAFADGMIEAHADFRVVATGNTYGTGGDRQYVGRQTLDAATLDRFVTIDVPVDEKLEERVAMALAPAKKRLVRELLTEVRRLRKVADDKRLPVMFSPRASIDGAKLLAAGATVEQVLRWRVIRGLSDAHRDALGLS